MATELERIAALETHHEHVDKTLTSMGRTLEAIHTAVVGVQETVRTEIDGVRIELGGRIDGVRTELSGRIEDVQAELGDARTELGGRIDALQQRIADDSASHSETKLKVAFRVIGWLVGIVTTVLGAVIGGLFVFARFLLPKLASAIQGAASAIV